MKITKQICKCITLSTVMLAVATMTWLPGSARAQDEKKPMKEMKGGEHMMMLNKVETKEQADSLKSDDTMAMVCAKCKTVYTTHVKQGVKGAQLLMTNNKTTELVGTHACPGCGGTWTITGVGKGSTTELKHSCTMCGEGSGFCCATTPDAKPTEGMEEKK